ncbi:MAG: hypothetical protein D6E12_00400 [Desulfovibrio sp.]|nr:MAG: hypothetical protein D6E12_00400 [Desulfovibrio sp.]
MTKEDNTPTPSTTRRVLGYIAALAITAAFILFGAPVLFKLGLDLGGSYSVVMAGIIAAIVLIAAIPALPPIQAMLLGQEPASARTFVRLYLDTLLLLLLQLVGMGLALPFIVLEMVVILALVFVPLGPASLVVYILQQSGVDVGSPQPGQDVALYMAASMGILLGEIFYWKWLRSRVNKAREWILDKWVEGIAALRG